MLDTFAGTESFAPAILAPPASATTSRSAVNGLCSTLQHGTMAGAMVPTHVSQHHSFPPVCQRQQVHGVGNSLLANLKDNFSFGSGVQYTSTAGAAYSQKLETINAILDAEVTIYAPGKTPPLLRTMKFSQQFGRLAQVVNFAAHPSQSLVSWRACKAHIYRLNLCNLHDPAHCISNPQFMKRELELWVQVGKVVWNKEYIETGSEKRSELVASTTVTYHNLLPSQLQRQSTVTEAGKSTNSRSGEETDAGAGQSNLQQSPHLRATCPIRHQPHIYSSLAPTPYQRSAQLPPRKFTPPPPHSQPAQEPPPRPLQAPKKDLTDSAAASAARHRVELASDPDALLYRYREYIAAFPLAADEGINSYYTGLLANTLIARGDESGDLARGAGYAKRFYWRLYARGDLASVLKLVDEEKSGGSSGRGGVV